MDSSKLDQAVSKMDSLVKRLDRFEENDHQRGGDGKFASSGGSGSEGRSGEREYESGYASKPKPRTEQYYGWSRPVSPSYSGSRSKN